MVMAKIPASTKSSLQQRLSARTRERWPRISRIHTGYRAGFACVDAVLADGEELRLCRPRHAGYQASFLPTGSVAGTGEDALDTACGLHLADPTAWT